MSPLPNHPYDPRARRSVEIIPVEKVPVKAGPVQTSPVKSRPVGTVLSRSGRSL